MIREESVTTVHFVPSMLAVFLRERCGWVRCVALVFAG